MSVAMRSVAPCFVSMSAPGTLHFGLLLQHCRCVLDSKGYWPVEWPLESQPVC